MSNDKMDNSKEELENGVYSEEMFETEECDDAIIPDETEIENTVGDQEQAEQNGTEPEPEQKLTKLPLTRVKNIMKMDPDVNLISQESVFVVSKATELFIGSLARETLAVTLKNKKKTIQRKDLDVAIETVDALCFLEGALD